MDKISDLITERETGMYLRLDPAALGLAPSFTCPSVAGRTREGWGAVLGFLGADRPAGVLLAVFGFEPQWSCR